MSADVNQQRPIDFSGAPLIYTSLGSALLSIYDKGEYSILLPRPSVILCFWDSKKSASPGAVSWLSGSPELESGNSFRTSQWKGLDLQPLQKEGENCTALFQQQPLYHGEASLPPERTAAFPPPASRGSSAIPGRLDIGRSPAGGVHRLSILATLTPSFARLPTYQAVRVPPEPSIAG